MEIDVLIARDHDHWRLYVAEESWLPPGLRSALDSHLEAWPISEPDLADLHRHMLGCDAPYEMRPLKLGGVQLFARGRSAKALAAWLESFLGVEQSPYR